MPTLDGVATVGVIARLEHRQDNVVCLEGLQRISMIDTSDHNRSALVSVMHDRWFGIADDLSAMHFAKAIREMSEKTAGAKYPMLKSMLTEHPLPMKQCSGDPYQGILDAILSDVDNENALMYTQQREFMGFAVATAVDDLSLPQRLAMLLTDDGTGRLEWLFHKKIDCRFRQDYIQQF